MEIYRYQDFVADRGLWGVGGLLLHELSHAYHDKFVALGFDNELVKQVWYSKV